MKNNTIRRVILLGALAIILVITTQTYWVMRSWDLTSQKFDQTANIALLNVAKDISQLNQTILPQSNLIKQLSSNSYAVNVNSQIDARNLDFYLKKNFDQFSLNEDYDYAIYDCHDEKMVYGRYVSYSALTDSVGVKKEFPKLDNPTATYYFIVRFPKRTSSLVASMSLTIVFTLISLLTVIFFIYALSVITRQKRLSELQRDFINNMTHEFKTPISTIKIAADVLHAHPLLQGDARLKKYTSILREQNNRLNNQVEKVLQLTRIDKDTLNLKLETIDLNILLVSILEGVQVKIEECGGSLQYINKAKKTIIRADVLHFSNIINNMLDNSIKYCKAGAPHLIVETENTSDSISLKIIDDGIGIDSEHQKKVFQRFYRVPTGDVHNVKGFGLGLYYVKNIVEAHHWRITLQSELEKGTTIILDIPLAHIKEKLVPLTMPEELLQLK